MSCFAQWDVTVCFRWMNHIPQSVATHVHTLFFAQWMLLSVSGEWTTSHKAWQLMYIHCSLLSGCYCLFQVNEPHPTKRGNSCTYIVLCSVDATVCFRWMNHIPQSVATHVHTLFFAQWMLLSVSGEWTTSHKAVATHVHTLFFVGCGSFSETDSSIHWAKNNVCTRVVFVGRGCFRWMNHIPQSVATHVHTLFFAQWMLLSVSGEWTTSHKAWQLMYIHCSLLSGCYCLIQVKQTVTSTEQSMATVCTWHCHSLLSGCTVCFRWMNHIPQSMATHVHTLFFAQWMLLSVSGEWTTSHKAWQLMYIHCSLLSGCYCLFQVNEPHPLSKEQCMYTSCHALWDVVFIHLKQTVASTSKEQCTYIVLCSVDVTVCFRWMNHIPQSMATHVHTLFFAQWMLLSVSGEWTTSHKAWQLMYIHCSLLSGCYCLFQVNEPHPTKHGNSCTYIVLCSVDVTVCFRWMNHIPQRTMYVHELPCFVDVVHSPETDSNIHWAKTNVCTSVAMLCQWMLLSVSGEWDHIASTEQSNSCTYISCHAQWDVTVSFTWNRQ